VGGNCRRANGDGVLALVTEGHFLIFPITRIRSFVANRTCRAWITSVHAPVNSITDLITGTEQSVVRTGGIIRSVNALIVDLVAGIHRTGNPVIAIGRCASLAAAVSSITGLRTVAEHAVVAVRIHRALGWYLAYSVCWVTLLTGRTFYRSKEATRYWIAAVGCTQVPIVAYKRFAGLAIVHWIAGLHTVADVAVVAGSVIGRIHTCIVDLVAGIHRTGNPVIAIGRCASLAGAVSGITGLRTVAEQAVVTVRVYRALGRGHTLSGTRIALLTGGTLHRYIGATAHWIAAVRGTQIPIVAIQRCTGLAIEYCIASFDAVADVAVAAGSVIGRVDTFIVDLVAGIHGTDHPVIAVGRRTSLADAGSGITGLRTVAEDSVVAVRINCARLAIWIVPVV